MKTKTIEYCKRCGRDTIHYGEKHKFRWVLHFFLFIFTGLIWAVAFIFYYMAKKDKIYNLKCSECAKRVRDDS